MKKILYILWLTAALLASCSKSEDPVPASQRKLVQINVLMADAAEVTRAVQDNRIYNICVMVFDKNGMLICKKIASSSSGPATIGVSDVLLEDNCHLYTVANMGHITNTRRDYFDLNFEGITMESELMKLKWNTKNNIVETTPTVTGTDTQALVLIGDKVYPDISLVGNSESIVMKRVNAKVNVTVTINTATWNAGMRVESMRVMNIPGTTYIFPHTTDYPVPADEWYTSDRYSPTWNATTPYRTLSAANIYLFENHRGTGPDKATTTAGVDPLASYLEIVTSLNGQKYIYKIYLGGDNTTDYNIERNTNYTVNININGVNSISSDIRITPYDDSVSAPGDWYITTDMLLHYDGIKNNGDDPRVHNNTTTVMATTSRPTLTSNVYVYSGGYVPVETDSPACDGAKNRWRNIAPDTFGHFNMPIFSSSATSNATTNISNTAPNCWGADCFQPCGPTGASATAIGSMEFDTDLLRPEVFTIECVFMGNHLNTNTGGNDLFAFFYQPMGPRFVTADVEVYQAGMGMIAGGNWNQMNYGATDLTNMKRRVVIQFDGQKLIGWYGREIVYTEPKVSAGAIPWGRGQLGATGGESNDPDRYCVQLNLGTWARHNVSEIFHGNIYAFRYYSRVLTKEELDHNFDIDKERFGMQEPR